MASDVGAKEDPHMLIPIAPTELTASSLNLEFEGTSLLDPSSVLFMS